MIDLTQMVVAVIGLLAAIITTIIVPWIRGKTGEQKWAQLVRITTLAAQAAEQMFPGAGKGGEKLEYALIRAQTALAAHGLAYDTGDIRAAIEAAVLALKRN